MKFFYFILIFTLLFSCNKEDRVFVYDNANIFDLTSKLKLDSALKSFEERTSCEIVVMVNRRTDDVNLEKYSTNMFEYLKIGKEGVNNGILIFLSITEKFARIQLGYGTEWCISQQRADSIMSLMTNYFKTNNFSTGIVTAIGILETNLSGVSWRICNKRTQQNCITKIAISRILQINNTSMLIRLDNGKEIELHFSKFMNVLIKKIKENYQKLVIYSRFISNTDAELLGVSDQ